MEWRKGLTKRQLRQLMEAFEKTNQAVWEHRELLELDRPLKPKECRHLAYAYTRERFGTAPAPAGAERLLHRVGRIMETADMEREAGPKKDTADAYIKALMDPGQGIPQKAAAYFHWDRERPVTELTLAELDELYDQKTDPLNFRLKTPLNHYRNLLFPTELNLPVKVARSRDVVQRKGELCFSQLLQLWLTVGGTRARETVKRDFVHWLRALLPDIPYSEALYTQFDPALDTAILREETCDALLRGLDDPEVLLEWEPIPRQPWKRVRLFCQALRSRGNWQGPGGMGRRDMDGALRQLERMTELPSAVKEPQEDRLRRCGRLLLSLLKSTLVPRADAVPAVATPGDKLIFVLLACGQAPEDGLLKAAGYDALYKLEWPEPRLWTAEDDQWTLSPRNSPAVRDQLSALGPWVLLLGGTDPMARVLLRLMGVFLRERGRQSPILKERFGRTGEYLPRLLLRCAGDTSREELLKVLRRCGVSGQKGLLAQLETLRPKTLLAEDLSLPASSLLWHLHYWLRASGPARNDQLAAEVLALYEDHWRRMLALLQYGADILNGKDKWENLYDQEPEAPHQEENYCRFYGNLLAGAAAYYARRGAPYRACWALDTAGRVFRRFAMEDRVRACEEAAAKQRAALPSLPPVARAVHYDSRSFCRPFVNGLYDSAGSPSRAAVQTEFAERILQCQVAVLMGNQIIDQPLILRLAADRDFLELIHLGFVTLSLFSRPAPGDPEKRITFRTLREYAVFSLRNDGFRFTHYPFFNLTGLEPGSPLYQEAKRLRKLAADYLEAEDFAGRCRVVREMTEPERELILEYVELVRIFDENLRVRRDLMEAFHQARPENRSAIPGGLSGMIGSHLEALSGRRDLEDGAAALYRELKRLRETDLADCRDRSDYMGKLRELRARDEAGKDARLYDFFEKLLDILYTRHNAWRATPNIHQTVEAQYAFLVPEDRNDQRERDLVRRKKAELVRDRRALDSGDLVRYVRECVAILQKYDRNGRIGEPGTLGCDQLALRDIYNLMSNEKRVRMSVADTELVVESLWVSDRDGIYEMEEGGSGDDVSWSHSEC